MVQLVQIHLMTGVDHAFVFHSNCNRKKQTYHKIKTQKHKNYDENHLMGHRP